MPTMNSYKDQFIKTGYSYSTHWKKKQQNFSVIRKCLGIPQINPWRSNSNFHRTSILWMNNHNHHEVTQGKILLSIHFCQLTDTGLIFLRKTEKEEKVSGMFCEGEKSVYNIRGWCFFCFLFFFLSQKLFGRVNKGYFDLSYWHSWWCITFQPAAAMGSCCHAAISALPPHSRGKPSQLSKRGRTFLPSLLYFI